MASAARVFTNRKIAEEIHGRCDQPQTMRVSGHQRKLLCSVVLSFSRRSNFGWRCAVQTLERAIEIGQVTKAGLEGYRCNAAIGPPSICQHAMRAHEAAHKHELRERRSFALEKLADIALGNPMASCHRSRRKFAFDEVAFDVVLDGA